MGPNDLLMHLQKDESTGGHWCAKIVFFSLMAILFGLVGLIILENRGINDRKCIKKIAKEFLFKDSLKFF